MTMLEDIDTTFLHRCCTQISSPLDEDAVLGTELVNAKRFARHHAAAHPRELAQALIWRVVESVEDAVDRPVNKDRAGAWALLTAIITECGDDQSDVYRSALGDHIAALLPHLVAHRWRRATTAAASSASSSAEGLRGRTDVILSYEKVIPASLVNGAHASSADAYAAAQEQRQYRGFLEAWKAVWRPDLYQQLKATARTVEQQGRYLPSQAGDALEVPEAYRVSLWRLRRTAPRPSIIPALLRYYGWTATEATRESNDLARPLPIPLPPDTAAVAQLDPTIHPTILRWLKQAVEKRGGCRQCDTWDHGEARCPCEVPFTRSPSDETALRRHRQLVATATGGAALPVLSYLEAATILLNMKLRLPLNIPNTLDALTQLIKEEKPYEELLAAFDVARGAVTGPRERHALWRHASYRLLPSRTVFAKPADDALSPCMARVETLFRDARRLDEWTLLHEAVEVLDVSFRRCTVGPAILRSIEEVRETASFFFCLVDGSMPVHITPVAYARVPEEVEALAVYKDSLCRICLEPFHTAASCPTAQKAASEEAAFRQQRAGAVQEASRVVEWDLQVAQRVLEDNNVLFMKYPAESYRLTAAMEQIDHDDRPAKEFRRAELLLAVKLVHERRLPVCTECRQTGHNVHHCERRIYRALKQEDLYPVDVQLNPRRLRHCLARYAPSDVVYGELFDAYDMYGRGAKQLPAAYLKAIQELDDARIPLAAARYSTETVQSFLLFSNSTDLLHHLRPLRSAAFPEVCLFCDSYHHWSEDCDRCRAEERGYLVELRRTGLDLWTYLQHRDRYDQLLPTDFTRGKESVLRLVAQFEEDYGPSGIGRTRFFRDNDLPDSMLSNTTHNAYASISSTPAATGATSATVEDADDAERAPRQQQRLPQASLDQHRQNSAARISHSRSSSRSPALLGDEAVPSPVGRMKRLRHSAEAEVAQAEKEDRGNEVARSRSRSSRSGSRSSSRSSSRSDHDESDDGRSSRSSRDEHSHRAEERKQRVDEAPPLAAARLEGAPPLSLSSDAA